MPASSQGSSVVWGGANIGGLTNFQCKPGTASFSESTSVVSTVEGTGANARVVKQYDCTAIDPGSVSVTLFGCPPYGVLDIGERATLVVTFEGGSLSCDAYLETFEVTGAVGQFLVGSATFKIA